MDKYADPNRRETRPSLPAVRALLEHIDGPGMNGPILQQKIDAARAELEKWS